MLNLYAGIGGNRKLWENVEVTAVENNENIARIYQGFFPNDKMIIADAHEYLLKHYKEYDFIWSSPPCVTHSYNKKLSIDIGQSKILYPDMGLYQEIIMLKQFCKKKWAVENVRPYYGSLINAQVVGRHRFWTNFFIPK